MLYTERSPLSQERERTGILVDQISESQQYIVLC